MGKQRQQLTTKEKEKIIKKVNVKGFKVTDVAKEYGRSLKTIYRVLDGTTSVEKVDRKPAMDDEIRKEILEMVRNDHKIHSYEIRPRLTKPVAISTINRVIRESPFYCKGRKKPFRRPLEEVTILYS